MSRIDQLYESIGGSDTVNAAIECFYRRVLEDENLRRFFSSADMARLHAGQSMFVSMLFGGRVVYTGKELSAAHRHARACGLTDQHFDAFLEHFRLALGEVGVDRDKAEKAIKLLEVQRGSVLNG